MCIKRSLATAGICREDGKRPDGATVMPWKGGRVLVWDATCPNTFAPSQPAPGHQRSRCCCRPGGTEENGEVHRLAAIHHFVSVAIESTGVFGPQAHAFFRELGRRIKEETGEPLSLHYLHQRIAVAIQHGNTAAVLGTSPPGDTDPIFIR